MSDVGSVASRQRGKTLRRRRTLAQAAVDTVTGRALREAVLSRSLYSVMPTLYAMLAGALQRTGFGTLKVQILASVALLFFVTIRYLIVNHLQLNNGGSMSDDNNNEVSWQDRFLAWAVQLFEFVWNGASGAVAVGVIFVKPSAWVDRGRLFRAQAELVLDVARKR
ncbi:hypothetical protein ACFFQW_44485 [Umezawaea endophytica]|uniref:Uncharacterized protein n=1 Tax=Umezawaea endophytica TaxID=1654476 RepID=A0A9X2VY50_9PSEU|nr:hypothetical protein [Umezawaea endophytica]MCS7484865.1 hypothetical protein [Umezawaea endophytica]